MAHFGFFFNCLMLSQKLCKSLSLLRIVQQIVGVLIEEEVYIILLILLDEFRNVLTVMTLCICQAIQ